MVESPLTSLWIFRALARVPCSGLELRAPTAITVAPVMSLTEPAELILNRFVSILQPLCIADLLLTEQCSDGTRSDSKRARQQYPNSLRLRLILHQKVSNEPGGECGWVVEGYEEEAAAVEVLAKVTGESWGVCYNRLRAWAKSAKPYSGAYIEKLGQRQATSNVRINCHCLAPSTIYSGVITEPKKRSRTYKKQKPTRHAR
ncbi:hypothetical protein BDW72DRAFT_59504 [Aspergillus terricola var. indicus]